MGNVIVSVLSVICSFLLCVYAVGTDRLWICGVMIVVGIIGTLFLAYLRANGKLDKIVRDMGLD